MAGFDTTKPRRRASHKAQLAAAAQKQGHGRVGTETVLGAARRSSRRAKDLQSMETVQTTLQQADITTRCAPGICAFQAPAVGAAHKHACKECNLPRATVRPVASPRRPGRIQRRLQQVFVKSPKL